MLHHVTAKANALSDSRTEAHRALFLGLQNNEQSAIRQLRAKLLTAVGAWSRRRGIAAEDVEEIVNDALLVCMRKIQADAFVFQGTPLEAYGMAIARRLIANRLKRQAGRFVALEEAHKTTDHTPLQALEHQERSGLLRLLLSRLGANGAKVISLYYLENYSDEEVIQRKLTPYTTVNALKTKRCKYMRQLRALAQEHAGLFKDLPFL